jgi:hypothetical protein
MSFDWPKILALAGTKKKLLAEFVEFMHDAYAPQEKITCSKTGEWTVFFRKASKSLCYVTVNDGGFTVTVVIGQTLSPKVARAPVSAKTKAMFWHARQFHDGRWLFFPVKTKPDLKDIKTLLFIKRPFG